MKTPLYCLFPLFHRHTQTHTYQGFSQVLRHGGSLQSLTGGGAGGGGLKSIHKGSMKGLKMLSENTCERVHLCSYKVKLLNFFMHICAFSRNHFMEGCFMFQWEGDLFFRWGFVGGGGEKNRRIRGAPPCSSTMGNPTYMHTHVHTHTHTHIYTHTHTHTHTHQTLRERYYWKGLLWT